MKPTAFPASASGVSERMAGFSQHLRGNGLPVGSRETMQVLEALRTLHASDSRTVRLVSQSVFTTCADEFERFDELFDAYWFNRGRSRASLDEVAVSRDSSIPGRFQASGESMDADSHTGSQDEADDADNDEASSVSGEGRLVGSLIRNREKVDLREFMTPESMAEACAVARRLAMAMSDRLSRRRIADVRGSLLDMRRIMRNCLSHGGEPVHLFRRSRPTRPVRIVALLDVSGSMLVYSRVFLAFLKGLVSHDSRTDAYLFHTSLVRISDALRDTDKLRAVNNLTMKAQGFGGGTRIGRNIEQFNRQYAARSVNGRTVVIIMSDGYDTDPPEVLARALQRLKKRGCRIVWLNPLKGWKDYAPVARGMAAALPFLDVFAAANTLASLAALEPHLATGQARR